MSRKYLRWTHQEDQVLIDILLQLYESGEIKNGTLQGHPNAKGLHNTRLVHWDELCKIFEYNRVDGTESMTPNDAASLLEAEIRATDSAPYPPFDTYAGDSNPIMEDLINEGFDMHAEGLRDVGEDVPTEGGDESASRAPKKVKANSSGTKRTRAKATDEYLNAIQVQMESMTGTLVTASTQIVRLANNICLPDDIAVKRTRVIEEITRLPGITYAQRLKAHRIFMKEPGDLEAFF
ncbi:hypothetical protein LINGRAHAP2_LOCUS14895 [Linum grandiflorum]